MKDPRPKCGSCAFFVRGSDSSGTCRHDPPTFSVVYRATTPTSPPDDESPDLPPPRRTSNPWGRWPNVLVDSAGCGKHPAFPAYAASLTSAKVEEDDTGNF